MDVIGPGHNRFEARPFQVRTLGFPPVSPSSSFSCEDRTIAHLISLLGHKECQLMAMTILSKPGMKGYILVHTETQLPWAVRKCRANNSPSNAQDPYHWVCHANSSPLQKAECGVNVPTFFSLSFISALVSLQIVFPVLILTSIPIVLRSGLPGCTPWSFFLNPSTFL